MARITVTIQGTEQDKGLVRLTEFIKQLEAVKSSLKQTERLITNEEPALYYQIVALTYSSPATVVIEPVSVSPNGAGDRTAKQFVTNLRQVARGRRPANSDLAALQSYQNLTSMLKQHVGKVEIKNGGKNPVVIDQKFASKIAKIIGPDELAEGSIFGTLEWLNLHHNINRFHIYPTVGPRKLDCDFPSELKPQVIAAIDRYVQVSGQLRYKHLEKFPYAVNVSHIEILPPESDLPTLYDLRGIAPNATGNLSAADFVRALRNENR
ncbi:MAG TPA: hypothetical protein VGO56_21450 [Pyrinomonadaceae bacterium]|jgi:hypothetical protein|nr:hypothetical protein [Pyrinomonadaceae bacterium]